MLSIESPLNAIMSSRIYRGVPKPAVDFLTRNKRALSKLPAKTLEKTNKQQTNVKKTPALKQPKQSNNTRMNSSANKESVTVSKSYLDSLLKLTGAPAQVNGSSTVNHVQLNNTQVPGLDHPSYHHTVTAPHHHTVMAPQPHTVVAPQPHTVMAPQPHTVMAPQPHTVIAPHHHSVTAPLPHTGNISQQHNNVHTTAKQEWLNDLAKQVNEKKQNQQKKQSKKPQAEEIYFPFGRPGCGAPIRSESGHVLADLRSKVRTSFEGPVQKVENIQQPQITKREEEYFPFGRPGCGAPNMTGSQSVNYQSHGAEMYNHPQQMNSQQQMYQQQMSQQQINYQSLPPNYQQPNIPSAQIGQSFSQSVAIPPSSYQSTSQNCPPTGRVEEYYPYGRPGGGAPVTRAQPPPTHPPQSSQQDMSPREGFGRGAGPYMNKYVQDEMNQRRRKELEYRAELAEQIAIKEREKINKRMAKQREEAIEEARLEEERQKLQQQYEKEAMEKRRKEKKALERQNLLQRRIEEARSNALEAKNKASSHTRRSQTHSNIRSPSMLQLEENSSSSEDISIKASRIPVRMSKKSSKGLSSTTSIRAVAAKKAFRQPVCPPSPPIPTLIKRRSRQPTTVRERSPPIPTLAKKFSQNNSIAFPKPLENRNETIVRPQSPPVPTLAKKLSHAPMKQSHDQMKKSQDPVRSHDPVRSQDPVSTQDPVRSQEQVRSHVTWSSDLVRSMSQDKVKISHDQVKTSHDQVPSQPRTQSPPVPTLAKKLQIPPSNTSMPSINRQPSCELIRDTTFGDHYGNQPTVTGPSRQQVILEQLAALKRGIMNHKSAMDQRVHQIMTRQKPNF